MSRLAFFLALLAAAALGIAAGVLAARADLGLSLAAVAGLGCFAIVSLAASAVSAGLRARIAERRAEGQSTVVGSLVGRLQRIETEVGTLRAAQETSEAAVERLREAGYGARWPGETPSSDATAEDIATLGALFGELADAVAEHEARLDAADRRGPGVAEQVAPAAQPATQPAASDTLAAIRTMLDRRGAPPAGARLPPPVLPPPVLPPDSAERPAPIVATPPVATPPPAPRAAPSRAVLAPEIAEALETRRIELFLQPVVTLPQRKSRFYEAVPRLKTADGHLLGPEARAAVEAAGFGAALEAVQLAAVMPVARRLVARGGEVALMCRLSPGGLAEPSFVQALADLGEGLPGVMLLLLDQAALPALSTVQTAAQRRLAAVGYRFGLDAVTDLRLDGPALAAMGMRLVKVPAALILAAPPPQIGEARVPARSADLHPADLSGLLARSQVELVVDGADTDAMVADLLDFDVRLAIGAAIAPPRPVRAEAEPAAAPATLGATVLQDALRSPDGPGGRASKREPRRLDGARQDPTRQDASRQEANRQAWRALARPISTDRR